MRLICIFIGLSILTGRDKKQESNSGAEIFEHDAVLLKKEVLHNFSSPTKQDTFRIYVTGSSIEEGKFHFQIITSGDSMLYYESLNTTWLLDYGSEDDTTATQKEIYIRNRIENFFNQNSFKQPAIKETDFYEPNYSNKEVWDDIRSDSTAIGFYYLVGKEDGRHVAYSKRLNKVVLYYNCC